MPSVIFARPRYEYGSYTDLYSLIQLSGYPLVYFDEIDPASDNVYILTMLNGENQHGWDSPRARIILYDLEWRLDGEYPRTPGVAEVWAADPWYAARIGARYVMLGSHVGLNSDPADVADKVYDTITLSYLSYRRDHLQAQLLARGVSIGPRGWGAERHRALIASATMLQVHQLDGVATVAPQRFALAAAYGLPMISEAVCEPGPLKDAVVWASYADLAETVAKRAHHIEEYGAALHDLLCVERSFRKCVDGAL